MKTVLSQLIDKILSKDTFIYGFADLDSLLSPEYSSYKSGISILRKLDDSIIDSISDGPTEEYYRHYDSVNSELAEVSSSIESLLQKNNINCKAVPPTFHDYKLDESYMQTLTVPLSHKMVATRAGLGWIGKTDLFISEKYGPRVRLCSVLLEDKVEPPSIPVEKSRCGKCTVCVNACPGKTATGREWDINTYRNEFFDPFKCRENCKKITKERLGREISICGICVSVCPIGKKRN